MNLQLVHYSVINQLGRRFFLLGAFFGGQLCTGVQGKPRCVQGSSAGERQSKHEHLQSYGG